jgi:hypothetical protein
MAFCVSLNRTSDVQATRSHNANKTMKVANLPEGQDEEDNEYHSSTLRVC